MDFEFSAKDLKNNFFALNATKLLPFLARALLSVYVVDNVFLKPGFHIIVTIVAIAENGCDDPGDRMETPIFFLMTIVTIRISTIVEIETSSISTIVAIK